MNKPIFVSEFDARRLRKLITSPHGLTANDIANLHRLEAELDRAQIVPADELPADVIAMNSTVELENLTDGEVLTFTLVFPQDADADTGRISILAPIGSGMLGFRVGDEFEWPVPSGNIRVRVRRLLNEAQRGGA